MRDKQIQQNYKCIKKKIAIYFLSDYLNVVKSPVEGFLKTNIYFFFYKIQIIIKLLE